MTTARLSPATERLARFILTLRRNARADLGDVALLDNAAELIRQARAIQRLNLILCERDYTPGEIKRRESAKDRAKSALLTLFDRAVRMEFGSDPRGFAIRLFLPDGSSNSFAGDGYGVPID